MIKGIIFDKDGVLFDSEPVYAKITIEALGRFGYYFTEEDYFEHWTRKGGNIEGFFKIHGIKLDANEFRKMVINLCIAEFMRNLPIIDGVFDVLQSFENVYSMALATASDKNLTDIKLKLSGFNKFFDVVVTKEDVVKRKPDPECFLIASKRIGILPENLVVIEDAEKGVIAAKKAGMKCIAIPTRHTVLNDFSSADIVLKSIKELTPELIKSL